MKRQISMLERRLEEVEREVEEKKEEKDKKRGKKGEEGWEQCCQSGRVALPIPSTNQAVHSTVL